MAREMEFKRTSVRLWGPIRERFDEALDRLGLKRDAYLNRVLETELAHLDAEVKQPNSREAQRFIADRLRDLKPSELVTLRLRRDLLDRMDASCARKRICRDAFFNRLLFLLTLPPKGIDLLFFDGDSRWRTEVWNECKHDGPFFQNVFYPLDPVVDPFWTIRAGLGLLPTDEDGEPREGVYTASLVGRKPQEASARPQVLTGLSCYLPDAAVRGTAENKATKKWLDELFGPNRVAGRAA